MPNRINRRSKYILIEDSSKNDMDTGITVYNYMDTFFCCKVEKDQWC